MLKNTLLLALLAVVGWLLFFYFCKSRSEPARLSSIPALSPALDESVASSLRDELARLESSVTDLAEAVARLTSQQTSRVPASEDKQEQASLHDVLMRLDRIELLLRTRGIEEEVPPIASLDGLPRNWNAIQDFWVLYSENKERACDGIRYMGYERVMHLFGSPTAVARDANGAYHWVYRRGNPEEVNPRFLQLVFMKGRVVDILAGNE